MRIAKLSVQPNKVFKWEKGLALKTSRKVVVTLPADLLSEGESIGSIIEMSDDDAHIGFQESGIPEKPFALILIELKPGQTLRMNRGTEAIIRSASSAPIDFEVFQ